MLGVSCKVFSCEGFGRLTIIRFLFVVQEKRCCTTSLCNEYLLDSRYRPPPAPPPDGPVVSPTSSEPPTGEHKLICICTASHCESFLCRTTFGCATLYELTGKPWDPYRALNYCLQSETKNDCSRAAVSCCFKNFCNNIVVRDRPVPDVVEREVTTTAVERTDPIESTTDCE